MGQPALFRGPFGSGRAACAAGPPGWRQLLREHAALTQTGVAGARGGAAEVRGGRVAGERSDRGQGVGLLRGGGAGGRFVVGVVKDVGVAVGEGGCPVGPGRRAAAAAGSGSHDTGARCSRPACRAGAHWCRGCRRGAGWASAAGAHGGGDQAWATTAGDRRRRRFAVASSPRACARGAARPVNRSEGPTAPPLGPFGPPAPPLRWPHWKGRGGLGARQASPRPRRRTTGRRPCRTSTNQSWRP